MHLQALDAILNRDRAITLGGLIGVTALSWGYMFYDVHRMNHTASCCLELSDAHLRAWPLGALGLMFVMWSVMMVAMMVPSVAPTVLLFAALSRKRRQEQRPYVPTSIFLAGYLLVWTGFSALVTLLQWRLHAAALLSPRMVSSSPWFGGAMLIAAGIFQFTPLKNACLVHCRGPLEFLIANWRDGYGGALKMGAEHGLSCAGCCWLLMVLLFVLGVMNLLWVATITLFVLIEKLTPQARWITRAGGAICILWGIGLLLSAVRS
jgi:predicted metal-binding membrane protein